MRSKSVFIAGAFIFLSLFLYLHQKVLIYVEAYKLTKNYHLCNELIDKRDYLVYNLKKETSVSKINQWAQKNNFAPAQKLLALNLKKQENLKPKGKFASLLGNLLGIPTASSTVLVEDKR
ncbi:MAG: hypothetical protein Q8O30_04245 [Candidatus Omnitrophota bacterium]|nr:hypothetical protein [Candidatus Omnitrophota bacterium]